MKKKPESRRHEVSLVRSSAAEYLTFVAATGQHATSVEMRYEDENIWLTQKMMATLYDVSVPAINQHLKRIFADHELDEEAVIKPYLITAADGKGYRQDAGKVSAELAKTHAESEFEKYRVVQDRLFESDFDRLVKQLGSERTVNDGAKLKRVRNKAGKNE